jgi:hypothetical protein
MLMLRKSKLTTPQPPYMVLEAGKSFPKAQDWYGCGRRAASGEENSMLGRIFNGRIL